MAYESDLGVSPHMIPLSERLAPHEKPYIRELEGWRLAIPKLIKVTLLVAIMIVLPLYLRPSVLNEDFFRFGFLGMIGIFYAVVIWHCVRHMAKGANYYWEVNLESAILKSPGKRFGAQGVIPLDDIKEIIRERHTGDGSEDFYTYIIDRYGEKHWLTTIPRFDILEFVQEIRRRRNVPYRTITV